MDQVSFSDLREKLAGLKISQEKLPAIKLLYIISPILLAISKQKSSGLNVQTVHYLMENWYEKQKISGTENILSLYPGEGYFVSYCFSCFSKLDPCINCMPIHCRNCQLAPTYALLHFQDFIQYRYKIHPVWIEKIFCDYLNLHERLTCQLLNLPKLISGFDSCRTPRY